MDEHKPWRPKMKNAPIFNPFESSTEWTAQIGGADRVEIEDEEMAEDNTLDEPATGTTDATRDER